MMETGYMDYIVCFLALLNLEAPYLVATLLAMT